MITPTMLQILQHALGTDKYGRGGQYRSHFVTGAGSTDHAACMLAVEHGLMTRHAGNALSGGDDIFIVTRAGVDYVSRNSKRPLADATMRRIAKGIQRYVLGAAEPFIVPNNTNNAPQPTSGQVPTVTTCSGRNLLVQPEAVNNG